LGKTKTKTKTRHFRILAEICIPTGIGLKWVRMVRMDWNLGRDGIGGFLVLVRLPEREISAVPVGTELITMIKTQFNQYNKKY
jgi:hypothetical protein